MPRILTLFMATVAAPDLGPARPGFVSATVPIDVKSSLFFFCVDPLLVSPVIVSSGFA